MPAVANDDQLCKVVEVQRYRKVSKVFLIHQAFSHWSERVACGCPAGYPVLRISGCELVLLAQQI